MGQNSDVCSSLLTECFSLNPRSSVLISSQYKNIILTSGLSMQSLWNCRQAAVFWFKSRGFSPCWPAIIKTFDSCQLSLFQKYTHTLIKSSLILILDTTFRIIEKISTSAVLIVLSLLFFIILSFLASNTHIRTPAQKHTSPCAPTLVCWWLFSPSCCSRASQSWALQRICATCGWRSRRSRMRQMPGNTFSNKSLSVRSWAGLCRPTSGSTWWEASSRLMHFALP